MCSFSRRSHGIRRATPREPSRSVRFAANRYARIFVATFPWTSVKR